MSTKRKPSSKASKPSKSSKASSPKPGKGKLFTPASFPRGVGLAARTRWLRANAGKFARAAERIAERPNDE